MNEKPKFDNPEAQELYEQLKRGAEQFQDFLTAAKEEISINAAEQSGTWTDEYRKIEKDLFDVYMALETSLSLVLVDVEDGQSRSLMESEEYDRTIKTIDIYISDANRRIENLKTLDSPGIQEANRITFLINQHTRNVQGFFDTVFTDSELASQLDGFDETKSIRTKCDDYFNIAHNLGIVLKIKVPTANPLPERLCRVQ